MPLFPISLKLRGRLCVVVGGGVIAESKIQSLLAAEAYVVVVAPEVTETVAAWARAGQIEWQVKLLLWKICAAHFWWLPGRLRRR